MKNKLSIIIVNCITMTRVIGTFILPIISKFTSPRTVIIYVGLLLLTDAIDGMLARRLKASTIFGSLLDAAADKLLGIACLAVLAGKYPIMLLPILTETIITIINTMGAAKGTVAESSTLGKIKTWVLGIATVCGFCAIYSDNILLALNSSTNIGNNLINFFELIQAHQGIIIANIASISVGAGLIVACDYQIKVRNDLKKARESGFVIKEIKLKKGKDLMYALFSEEYYQKTKKEPLIKKLGEKTNEKNNRK